MPDNTCLTCKYFKPHDEVTDFPGECRRYPPVQHHQDSSYSYTPVNEEAWCGEYQQLPAPPL